VAPLLPEHAGPHLRGGQQRPGKDTGGSGRAHQDVARGRAEGRHFIGVCQQTGSAQRHDRQRAHRQTWTPAVTEQKVVHPGHVCSAGSRPLRGLGLAQQRAQQSLKPKQVGDPEFQGGGGAPISERNLEGLRGLARYMDHLSMNFEKLSRITDQV